MVLKLLIKKPKFWQKKWKIKKPVLYIFVYLDGKWVNTYWWGGNRENRKMGVKFKNSSEVEITWTPEFIGTYYILGNTGTDLLVNDGLSDFQKIKGVTGDKEGFLVSFGHINSSSPFMFYKNIEKEGGY